MAFMAARKASGSAGLIKRSKRSVVGTSTARLQSVTNNRAVEPFANRNQPDW